MEENVRQALESYKCMSKGDYNRALAIWNYCEPTLKKRGLLGDGLFALKFFSKADNLQRNLEDLLKINIGDELGRILKKKKDFF